MTLRRKLDGGGTRFEFAPSYLADKDRSVLSLGMMDAAGDPMPRMHSYPGPRIDPFFANLLPEGAMRRYLAHSNGVKAHDDFQLLRALGEDLPGAVQVATDWVPEVGDAWADLEETSDPPAWLEKPEEPDNPFDKRPPSVRFSLAGVQLKHSLSRDPSGRMTLPVYGGGGAFILKIPFAEWDGVAENEWSMLHLARDAGFATPDAELVPLKSIGRLAETRLMNYARGVSEDAQCLVVRRFTS